MSSASLLSPQRPTLRDDPSDNTAVKIGFGSLLSLMLFGVGLHLINQEPKYIGYIFLSIAGFAMLCIFSFMVYKLLCSNPHHNTDSTRNFLSVDELSTDENKKKHIPSSDDEKDLLEEKRVDLTPEPITETSQEEETEELVNNDLPSAGNISFSDDENNLLEEKRVDLTPKLINETSQKEETLRS